MSLEGASDAELVRQFKSGDAAAYDAIVRRFQDRVSRLACVWLYDEQHAADVAQEVFLRGFRGLRKFRFRASPFTWLYRTTRFVCNEFNRRRHMEPLDREPSDPSLAPERTVTEFEAARRVRELVNVLPEKALLHKALNRLKLTAEKTGMTA